jgi:malonyl-CoA/methylmalonyl-CoA synthetase
VVVAKAGVRLEETALLAGIAGSLARFKQPRRIFIADELPRNTMGKVQKAMLRERYATTFMSS